MTQKVDRPCQSVSEWDLNEESQNYESSSEDGDTSTASHTVIFEMVCPTIQGVLRRTFCEELQRKEGQRNFIALFSGFRALIHRY
jgi:hypothetical protein